jgi:hypothetical protein
MFGNVDAGESAIVFQVTAIRISILLVLTSRRILDPLMVRLLDLVGSMHDTKRHAKEWSLCEYLLEKLSTVLEFGGQGLSKACQVTEITKSVHPTLVKRAENCEAMLYCLC